MKHDDSFCSSTIRTTDDNLRCAKRPHTTGAHVGVRADGSVRWWGVDERPELVELGRRQHDVAVTTTPRPINAHATARAQGYTGDTCSKCGSLAMIRTGTCATCSNCGEPGSCG